MSIESKRLNNAGGLPIKKFLPLMVAALTLWFMPGCTNSATPGNLLTSLVVTPATQSISAGGTQQYTATATYTDGSMQDITTSVGWSSSSPSVASVSSSGLATGASAGTTTITATAQRGAEGPFTATATLTVMSNIALTSISVTPAMSSIIVGGNQQFTATGTYADNSMKDITSSVTWTSTPTTVATINSAGLATGVGVGTATVSAALSGITGTATLTVTATGAGGSSSGSTGILILPLNGQNIDAAYQPTVDSNGNGLVQVVNLDAADPNAAVVASVPMPAGYTPNATTASQTSLKVVVISYTSSDVQVIDATTNTVVNTFTSPVTGSATFSGGSCTLCGALINPANNLAVLDTAQGYYTMDLTNGTFTALVSAFPAENFSLDTTAQWILSPTYNQDPNFSSEVQVLDITGNTVSTNTALNIVEPDSAATDLSTGVGVVVDEDGGNQTLINLNQLTVASGNWTAPTTLFAIPGCLGDEMTMISADSGSHALFSSEEFGSCTAVESLTGSTPTGAPPAPATYVFALMPNTPDGNGWANGGDPHGVAVFTSVVDGKHYGFLVNAQQSWVAKVDLSGALAAGPLPGGSPDEIDLTPYTTYLSLTTTSSKQAAQRKTPARK